MPRQPWCGSVERAAAQGMPSSRVGVGSAGVIDAGRGVVISATDAILGWTGTALTAGLARRLGLPRGRPAVNDVHAHALGEAWHGAAAGTASSLMVAFGTGVGGQLCPGRPAGAGTPLCRRPRGALRLAVCLSRRQAAAVLLRPRRPCRGHRFRTGHPRRVPALGGSSEAPDTRAVFALAEEGNAEAAWQSWPAPGSRPGSGGSDQHPGPRSGCGLRRLGRRRRSLVEAMETALRGNCWPRWPPCRWCGPDWATPQPLSAPQTRAELTTLTPQYAPSTI